MLKVIKRYSMPLKRTPMAGSTLIPGADTIFSSYPGTLHSVDDFYMTRPGNMTIIETTISNNNDDLTHNIIPISVPEWMRVVIANRLSDSGQDWVNNFFLFNDGTYNNEWMIVDFKQFTPGQSPRKGFLTVAEQLVTNFLSQDMTDTLVNKTYWASYNNVYFPEFRKLSGEEALAQQKGPELYSWKNSSRAKIFERDHVTVVNLTTMIHMMRYNDFKNDPLSKCNCTPPYSSELTIAARCDLNPSNGTYPDSPLGHRIHGATDAKITNYAMMQNFNLVAIAGPTSDTQPPFVWSESDFDTKVRNGHIKRITDNEIQSLVLEIVGTNVSTTYVTCPADPKKTLGIKLPFLVMIIKNLKKYFTFEVQVLDDRNVRRRFRASNYQSTTRVKPFICTMPMRLDDGWNQIQFNLSDFTRRAYGTNYIETLRVQIHANCRIRRVYFSDRLYSEDELPPEFKLYLPVQKK
ncbi:unnamed protein product [Rotaria magnacalcarata]|uniref:Phospholipase B-like n=2 Tax=Rotaria TaxID=231623 RepID=A0A8S2JM30_9BILA|nr:unnamed protein product [Rotaria magnacalcarata]